MIILDTNVVSALMQPQREPKVIRWADRQPKDQLLITAISVMELRAGVEKLPPGRARRELEKALDWALDDLLEGRVLNFDRRAAYAAARFNAECRRKGKVCEAADVLIAGIAISRRIPIATRNVRHFEELGVRITNPWDFRG